MDYYSKKIKFLTVLQFIFFEVSDLIFDWDFYAEISKSDRYGETTLSWTVFGFAMYGSFLFILTFIFMVMELRIEQPIKADDVIAILTTWTEDVPQMAMALYVAVDAGEPITGWVQYTKAGFAIAESFLRCVFIIIKYCIGNKYKRDERNRQRCYAPFTDVSNFIGYLLITGCAMGVLIKFRG